MGVVSGENIILYKLDTSTIPATEVPFACSTSCTFSSTTDVAELASATNAYFKLPTIDLSNWNVTCDGLTTLSGYSIDDIANEQKNRTIFTIRFTIDNGGGVYEYISGFCFISNYSVSGSMNSVSPYSISFTGSGVYYRDPTPVTTTTSTSTTSTTESPYNFYLADMYDCFKCTVVYSNIKVSFPIGYTAILNKFYKPIDGSNTYVYFVKSASTIGAANVLQTIPYNTCTEICQITTTTSTTTSTTSTTSTTTSTTSTTSTTTTKAPFTACMSDFSDASACNCDGLSYGTWTFYGSGNDICDSSTITSTGILSEIENNGFFWIASGSTVRYYQKNGTTSSATAQAACFVCTTTTSTTSTTSTTIPPPFQGVVCRSNAGGSQEEACYTCPQSFTMTGNQSTFCDSTVFTADEWFYLATGDYWISYSGNVVRVSHTSGQNSATKISAGCQTCPATSTSTTTSTTIAPTFKYYVAERCDNPSVIEYFKTSSTYSPNTSLRYNNYCWKVIQEQGTSGVDAIEVFIDCEACNAEYPTTTTSTTAPPSCECWSVYNEGGATGSYSYSRCSDGSTITRNIEPGVVQSNCISAGTSITVIFGLLSTVDCNTSCSVNEDCSDCI